jgi:predicted metal-dependent phosphoesterase TrpH
MKADLHMHSTHSDGRLGTLELFKRAKDNQVDIIAITDHDIVKGVEKNREYSKEYGVEYIPGIELSTVEQGKPVHVLGYFKDESYQSKEMLDYFVEIKARREDRAKKFISNLKEFFDIHITYEEVLGFSRGVIARPHIAKAITVNYPQYDFEYVFKNFIGDNSKAYVPSCELSVEEGIELLRRNNCIVVLAHPTLLKKHIREYVLGLDYDGLEAKYYRNKDGDEDYFRNLAKKRNMIITGGGDFHGIIDDPLHGDIGEIYIDGTDLKQFMDKYKFL